MLSVVSVIDDLTCSGVKLPVDVRCLFVCGSSLDSLGSLAVVLFSLLGAMVSFFSVDSSSVESYTTL